MSNNNTKEGIVGQLKILVAEDNPINQKVIRIILERSGCEFEIANDGLVALQKFKTGDYNLVLMDCQMPNLDGLQTSVQIRDYESLNSKIRTPIIAMTANAMMGDRERCMSVGMDDFLAKPFKSNELTSILQRWAVKNVA